MARPLIISDEQLRKRLLQAARAGVSNEDVCAAGPVAVSTLYWVLKRGGEAEQKLAEGARLTKNERLLLEFSQAYARARADARLSAASLLQVIIGNPDVDMRVRAQTAQWFLERNDPENWGRQRIEYADVSDREIIIRVEYEELPALPDETLTLSEASADEGESDNA